MVVKLIHIPLAVNKEYTAGLNVINHLVALCYIRRVMAGNKVSLVYVIGALNRLIAETQVRNGNTAGLLRVILEVSLNVFIGMVTDNLNRVFVSTNGTVAAETPELTFNSALSRGVRSFLLGERKVGNIIVNTDGEVVLRLCLIKLLVNSKNA